MNHSKYNQKYDPKHNGSQPAVTPVSVPVSATAPTVVKSYAEAQADKKALETKNGTSGVHAKPAEPVAAPQREAKSQADGHAAPAKLQAAAPSDTKSGEAMVSEGGHTATANVPHAVREPSAPTGGLAPLPAAHTDSETGEKAPAISAKPIS
jgi:hypothetical protein